MHAGDRRSRRRAQVDAADRRAVRIPPGHRPEDGLPYGLHADADVAADVVRVVRLLIGGGAHRRDLGLHGGRVHGARPERAEAAGVGDGGDQGRVRHPAHAGQHHWVLDAE